MNFTFFMNRITNLKNIVIPKLAEAGHDAESIRKHLAFLDKVEIKAEASPEFMADFIRWLSTKRTILLRDIAATLKYDYWNSLEDQNIIDFYDSV